MDSEKPDADAWRENLLHLAKMLPLVHGNLFHAMTREQFDEAVKSLRHRIPSLEHNQIIVELAIEIYRKSFELNPKNPNALRALQRLVVI